MDKNTTYYGSIASKPGSFGLEFHNKGFNELGLNSSYQALKILPEQLAMFMQIVRQNPSFMGIGVSMPHKLEVMKYIDSLHYSAERCGAVNTVIRQGDSTLRGFNTDYMGAKRAIESSVDINGKDVYMLGAGGAAQAVSLAVKELGGKLHISNRNPQKASDLAKMFGAETFQSEYREYSGELLINATSIGMAPDTHASPVDEQVIENFEHVMDLVVTRGGIETKFVQDAKKLGKPIIHGLLMTTYQGAEQFKLYTGKELPSRFLDDFMQYWANGQ